MTEVDQKVARVANLARTRNLGAILLTRQPNFSWLSAGQSNRIDGSIDVGAGSLVITADTDRYVVANSIEMPRVHGEALRGLGFEPIVYPWADDHADAAAPLTALRRQLARELQGDVGSDVSMPGAVDVGTAVSALHTPLTDAEVARYRALGREIATAVEQLCRSLRPGLSECEVAARVNSVVAVLNARAIVTLVAGDERITGFRHPVPTMRPWTHTLLIGLCAERQGLVVALSRIISIGRTPALQERTIAAASVFGTLLGATREGATGAQLFAAAANAYRQAGYPGEEARHHQGGAIGYRSRDWIAHPASEEVVHDRQAFAWNPSITGTKIEDTALLVDDRLELITSTGNWPAIEVSAGRTSVAASGILEL